MKKEKKNKTGPNEVENAANYTAQLVSTLRQPEYSSFIEDIQKKIGSDPQYLRKHREETFRQVLGKLDQSGALKDIQPSEQDVEAAIMAIVGRKKKR